MNNSKVDQLLKEFTPELENTSKSWYFIFLICILIFAFGIYGLVTQITEGHIVTGMRDHVVWGVYIVNFIFFMGLSYAGALISGVLHLFKSEWRKPIIRMSELITVISLVIGPVFILFCIGRLDRLHYLIIYPRIQSPITWDVIAISTDIIGCFIFLYLSFIEDFAYLRDYKNLNVKPWRKKIYRILSLGYKGTIIQKARIKRSKNIMAAMIIAIAIIVYSVLAWIFGVTLQPGWHSTIFGPYFVIAAVYSGTGLLIIIMWIYREIYHLEEYITLKHFVNIGTLLLIVGAFYGYFTFSDYLTKWYGSVKMDKKLIDALFTNYYGLFILANYVGVLVPIVVVGFRRFRNIRNITISAVITVIALWVNRFLIVVPTLETPYIPIQDTRSEWLTYSSTWVEWSLTMAGVAVFCMLFMLATKLVPIVSISELAEENERGLMRE
ncbi:MAG: polysulfide reductase NrfD [Bacteroidetes bacterium]|jgi:Ni/Fe-hydrogenase subunit HybB-like protein|nr:polysulfide reductase NrfD [Bacteroidota bacterium]MBT6685964.1 polysulfide reductase NrfD [Bacteroidota bacterium]MBT7144436.1 polysulfide reductase NrfD [Bacteroidota bacterium]MBT7490845.1 polysulfide reductase NrfD [Bacteroidota bacterium]